MKKQRLDQALVARGIVESRAKAQALILARRIRVNGGFVDKAGAPVSDDAALEIVALEHPWVGRGGMKLAGALEAFPIDLRGRVCVDIGASTGGFTHVMLANGAAKVHAIDVGHGQLDSTLRDDPRVVNREKTNARYLAPEDFHEPIGFVTIDVSFISLELILPAVHSFLGVNGDVVALIKPQFEVGKGEVGKGGIVRDPTKRQAAVEKVTAAARDLGFDVRGLVESPVKGAEGNLEYLLWLQRSADRDDAAIFFRVVLTGSECVGKTILARELARHFATAWVPEISREYAESKGSALDAGDVEPIARAQMQREDELAPSANRILIKDTDLVSTCVYAEHYYGSCSERIRQASIDRKGDLYLLLDIDIPWVPDPPNRDRGHMREAMQQLFRDALTERGIEWVDVRGSWDERRDAAIEAIESAVKGPMR